MGFTEVADKDKGQLVTTILKVLADQNLIYTAIGNAVMKTAMELHNLAKAANGSAAKMQAYTNLRAKIMEDVSALDGRYASGLQVCDQAAGWGGAAGAAGAAAGGGGGSSSGSRM
jgi:hypothetical protein